MVRFHLPFVYVFYFSLMEIDAMSTIKKVLVVDDSRLTRTLIKNALVAAGYEVGGEAANGREALELYGRLKPDLVTMDVVMPDMDGVECARQILSKDRQAVILIVSSKENPLTNVDLRQIGIKGVVTKPLAFDPKEISKAINAIGAA